MDTARLELEFDIFMENASYIEINCYLKYLPMTDGVRIQIIDRMEELECDMLLQEFIKDYRKNE